MAADVSASLAWRKSSFSADNGNCVEIAWRKSSFSADNGDCVELANHCDAAGVRDSKNPDGPALWLSDLRPLITLAKFAS
ncbi:uncharacterized protein DUF397 [Herbihabitans rhizosphaerae]|uniref:Uncharacterized protein DUF397 n=1 Tax=Herbihabitans rhizosphaerae TaxID=1872711 RepID=A0A4Q7L7D2_9PSEU|nr:DUF397 domain-containing protein [Herbihabitans rhizosphaerae]RZS45206.1 uncharacterized protein DUF397 [Herbihabitans rhizosphaerae]